MLYISKLVGFVCSKNFSLFIINCCAQIKTMAGREFNQMMRLFVFDVTL